MKNISDTGVTAPAIVEDQLVLPETTAGLTLADYVPVLRQYRDINSSMVFDYHDKKGNAAARSHVAKIRRVKAPINEIHKRLKADYKAIVDQMDADRREALAVVEEMIEYHDKHLRAVAEEEAMEAERRRIEQEIADCWDMAHEMNAIVDQQRELDRQAAEQARIAAEQADEQRRLQIEREKKEAAEKAAENARIAEQARAECAIEDAERRAREAVEKAEREKAEALAKTRAEEEQRLREEEQAKSNLENIKRVHWLIIPELIACGITEEQAKTIIIAIREGKIPAISIDYRWESNS